VAIWRRGVRHTDGVPYKWEIIRDELADEIRSGVHPPGAVLPSIRELMAKYEATAKTIDAAYRALVEWRMVEKEPQRGHRVTGVSGGSVAAQLARHEERLARLERHVGLAPPE
jgi:DNA-binding GntR family transcriptional regulator